jgi:hypothetical protein
MAKNTFNINRLHLDAFHFDSLFLKHYAGSPPNSGNCEISWRSPYDRPQMDLSGMANGSEGGGALKGPRGRLPAILLQAS